MPNLTLPPDYPSWLNTVKSRIRSARSTAARALNRELLLLYWDLGEEIVAKLEKPGWGKSVVERLASDLKSTFPDQQGFSTSNLWRMQQLVRLFSDPKYLAQAVRELKTVPLWQQLFKELPMKESGHSLLQTIVNSEESSLDNLAQVVREMVSLIPWGHHVVMLSKMGKPEEHFYYVRSTAAFGWTRAVLMNQIKAGAYERNKAEGKSHNFHLALPEHLAEQAEETLKSSYQLEFLGIGHAVKECQLEDALIEKLKDFILELGYGFCFIGRQYRVKVGRKDYLIDLLFYHRFLKCLVAIELKVGEFEPEFAGKMDFYLNVLNEKERAPDDNPSIGIILCAEKDDIEVEFALKSKGNPIGVAEYQLKSRLPTSLKGKIPTAEELKKVLRERGNQIIQN